MWLGVVLPLLAGCGGGKPEPEPEPEAPLDPYRAPMARRINEVLYASDKPKKILEELALMGVVPGLSFDGFKETTGIDDWFAEEWGYDKLRQTSLTCGLSPVVGDDGRMVVLFRSRKVFDGKMYEELRLTPE